MTKTSLREDIAAYMERDPAAHSRLMITLTYPGFHAVAGHRAAQWLWRRGLLVLGRMASQLVRWLTGIEIHPAATIGRRLVIDHGMGLVIGETAEIGDNVTLYHGVTLGGVAPAVDSDSQKQVKRHPTILDGAIVGSGAQILGPVTVGTDARVGANAVVVSDVPDGATVVGIPARQVMPRDRSKPPTFAAYGTPTGEVPDPVAKAIDGLLDQVSQLQQRVKELESENDAASPPLPANKSRTRRPSKDERSGDKT